MTGNVDMLKRIAVDVGYVDVKALSGRGERTLFPSVIAPDEEDLALDDALGTKRSGQRITIHRPGAPRQTWLFGQAALVAPGATRPWAEEASSREGYEVLVMAAVASLIRITAVETVDVDLVLGQPLGVYGAQREKLREALRGQEAYVAVNERVPVHLRFSSVLVHTAGDRRLLRRGAQSGRQHALRASAASDWSNRRRWADDGLLRHAA